MKLNQLNGFILDELGRIVGEQNGGEKTVYPEPYESYDGNPFWDAIQGRNSMMDVIPNIDQYRKNEFNRKNAIIPDQYQAFPNLEKVKGLLKNYGVTRLKSI